MQEIDWQRAMENTEIAAKAASIKTDRAVGGVAQLLNTQRHHSSNLKELKQAVDGQRALTEALQRETKNFLTQPRKSQDFRRWDLLGVFLGGVACGGFLWS